MIVITFCVESKSVSVAVRDFDGLRDVEKSIREDKCKSVVYYSDVYKYVVLCDKGKSREYVI